MVTNLSLASVLMQSLDLLWVGNAVAESPINGALLCMRHGKDCALSPTPELHSFACASESATQRNEQTG